MTASPVRPTGLPGLAIAAAGAAVLAAAIFLAPGAMAPADRWAGSALGLALFVAGRSLRRGAGTFGLLAALFLAGGRPSFT